MHFEEDKVNQILGERKRIRNWTGFQQKENHRGLMVGTAFLVDATDTFIPGMTLQIEIRVGTAVADCLITFSIFQRIGSVRRRAYQLEVCPGDKLSHNGATPVYGPHEHLPNEEVNPVHESGVDCSNWHGSLAWFLSRTNIDFFDLEQPC